MTIKHKFVYDFALFLSILLQTTSFHNLNTIFEILFYRLKTLFLGHHFETVTYKNGEIQKRYTQLYH